MKTRDEIYMDFQRAMEQADKLESIAVRIKGVAEDERGTVAGIGQNWTGENAEAFQEKALRVGDRVEDTGADVRKVARAIREIAQRTYKAEMAALTIASE